MSEGQVNGSFRSDTNGCNAVDISRVPGGSVQWSPGSTIIDTATLTPQSNQNWTLQSLSIQAYLNLFRAQNAFAFGKFGKIIWGLSLPQQSQSQSQNVSTPALPYTQGLLPLPQDSTYTGILWDPDADPLPPTSITAFPSNNSPINGNFLSVGRTIQIQNPFAIIPGQQINIGIWILPSLWGTIAGSNDELALGVYRATYNLTYSME